MVTQDVREAAIRATMTIFFIPAKLLHNQNIMAGLLPRLVKMLDARKGLIFFNSFYDSLSGKPQHFSVAGNGHYLFFHTANIGNSLQLTIFTTSPYPNKIHKENKESNGYQDRRIFPRPYTPTPPIYITRQSETPNQPRDFPRHIGPTRATTPPHPPPSALAQPHQHGKAKKTRPPSQGNPQPQKPKPHAPRGVPLQERTRRQKPPL